MEDILYAWCCDATNRHQTLQRTLNYMQWNDIGAFLHDYWEYRYNLLQE